MAVGTMARVWFLLSVVIVVLIPLLFAEDTKVDGDESDEESTNAQSIEDLRAKLSQAMDRSDSQVKEIMRSFPQGGAEGGQLMEEFMSGVLQGRAKGRKLVEDFISRLSQRGAKGGISRQSVLKEFSQMVAQNLLKEEQKIRDQGIAAGEHLQVILMNTASQGESETGNATQEFPRQEETVNRNTVLELLKKRFQASDISRLLIEDAAETIKRIKAISTIVLMSIMNMHKEDNLAGHSNEEMSIHKSGIQEDTTEPPQGNTTEDNTEETPQAEESEDLVKETESSHQDYIFNSLYSKVVKVTRGWMDRSLEDTVLSLYYKSKFMASVFGTVKSTVMKRMLGRPLASSKKSDFIDQCGKKFQKKTDLTCKLAKGLLHVAGVAATTAGHLSEAYVRTVLFQDSVNLQLLNREIFRKLVKYLSLNLVMLKNVFKMAVNFKDAVSARYLKGNYPVPGTEQYFIQASDELYSAIAELDLISTTTGDSYMQFSALLAEPMTLVRREFSSNYKIVVMRGIPGEYKTSPFPPLSYYWDMATVQYVVSVLSEIESCAQLRLKKLKDGTESLLADKRPLVKVVNEVHEALTLTGVAVKKNSLQTALKAAGAGLLSVMIIREESGIELWEEEETVTLSDLLRSSLRNVIPQNLRLGKDEQFSMGELPDLIPSSYNQLISIVNDSPTRIIKAATNFYIQEEETSSRFPSEKSDSSGSAGISKRAVNFDLFLASIDAEFYTLMINTLLNETSEPVLQDVMTEKGELVKQLKEGVTGCTLDTDCGGEVYKALVETTLIMNNPELFKQWESTRSNPVKGKFQ